MFALKLVATGLPRNARCCDFLCSEARAKSGLVRLLHFSFYAVGKLLDLLDFLNSIEGHDLIVLREIFLQLLRKLGHLVGIAADLNLTLLVGSDGLLFLNRITGRGGHASHALALRYRW